MVPKTQRKSTPKEIGAEAQIRYLASSVEMGGQRSGWICPFCKGGDSHEKSLSLKRLLLQTKYRCHRAACNMQGTVNMTAAAVAERPKTEFNMFGRAMQKLVPLPDDVKKLIEQKYQFDNIDFAKGDLRWSPDLQRLYLPIKAENGVVRGGTFRALAKDIKPKTYTYLVYPDVATIAFYRNMAQGTDKLLIVEDQLSAIAACGGPCSTVALCGIHCNVNTIREINHVHPKDVVIALDPDALNAGIRISNMWGGMFDKCRVAKPPKDLKDMDKISRRKWVEEVFK